MGRIKSTRDAAEIESRLRQIICKRESDPRAMKAKIICIAGLAYLYGVDLGPTFYMLARTYGYVSKTDKQDLPEARVPQRVQEPEPATENSPLTTPSVGVTFDELEEDPNEQD